MGVLEQALGGVHTEAGREDLSYQVSYSETWDADKRGGGICTSIYMGTSTCGELYMQEEVGADHKSAFFICPLHFSPL